MHLPQVVRGESDDPSASHQCPGRLGGQVFLAEVDPMRAAAEREVAPIVDDQLYAAFAGELDTPPQIGEQLIDGGFLIADLRECCPAPHQLFKDLKMAVQSRHPFVGDRVDRRKP